MKLLSMGEAIRKMTSLPARRLGLHDRGLIAPGRAADLVLFDPDTIADTATFEKPHSYAVGIKRVFVNGRVAFDGHSVSRKRAGHVIRAAHGR
jgi:N-acyl-D-aspartate/D-glutamate deacylase